MVIIKHFHGSLSYIRFLRKCLVSGTINIINGCKDNLSILATWETIIHKLKKYFMVRYAIQVIFIYYCCLCNIIFASSLISYFLSVYQVTVSLFFLCCQLAFQINSLDELFFCCALCFVPCSSLFALHPSFFQRRIWCQRQQQLYWSDTWKISCLPQENDQKNNNQCIASIY